MSAQLWALVRHGGQHPGKRPGSLLAIVEKDGRKVMAGVAFTSNFKVRFSRGKNKDGTDRFNKRASVVPAADVFEIWRGKPSATQVYAAKHKLVPSPHTPRRLCGHYPPPSEQSQGDS